jgi:hypothetical protein
MKYGKVWASIIAIIGAIIAFIFGKRSGILDNGARASAIGSQLDGVISRAKDIERNSSIASADNRKIGESIDRAIIANDDNIGIFQKIRARGSVKKVDPTD